MPPYPKTKSTRQRTITANEYQDMHNTEDQHQIEVERYLDDNKIPYIRIPEVITRLCSPTHPIHKLVHQALMMPILKAISKYFKGWADLIIFKPGKKYNHCLIMELKRNNNVMTTSQKKIARHLNVIISKSKDDSIKTVEEFLNDNN